MRTEVLIHQLAMELKPVRPLGRPVTRLSLWLLFAVALTSLGIVLIGVRPDLLTAFTNSTFFLRASLSLAVSIIAALAAFTLSVPGSDRRWPSWLLWVPVGGMLLLLGYLFYSAESYLPGVGLKCLRTIVIFSIGGSLLLYFMLKEAAPLRSGTVGLLAALGAAAFANFGTQFVCKIDAPGHFLVWHLVPIVLLCGIGILVGRLVFRWNEQKRPGARYR